MVRFQLINPKKTVDLVEVKTNPLQCWNDLTSRSKCTICLDACPEKAITLDPILKINETLCHRCGLCAAVCPLGAISIPLLYTQDFLEKITEIGRENGEVIRKCVLTCVGVPKDGQESSSQNGQENPFLCLAALEPAHLINLVEQGVKEVILDTSFCKTCRVTGESQLENCVEISQAWLEALGMPGSIGLSNKESHSTQNGKPVEFLIGEEGYSRRRLFRKIRDRGMVAVATRLELEEENDGGSELKKKYIPSERTLLLRFLQSGKRLRASPSEPKRIPIKMVRAGRDCRLCQSCAQLCPSGALVQEDNPKKAVLFFQPYRCIGCAECDRLCPYGALKSQPLEPDDFPVAEKKVIFAKIKVCCERCERPFIPTEKEEICPACQNLAGVDEEMREILGW